MAIDHVSITEGCSSNAEWRKLIIWYPREKKKNEHALTDLLTILQQLIKLVCTVLVLRKD